MNPFPHNLPSNEPILKQQLYVYQSLNVRFCVYILTFNGNNNSLRNLDSIQNWIKKRHLVAEQLITK